MLLQLAGFIFDCTCIILPKPIVHIDKYCYLYYSTLFIPFTALYFILHLSYALKKGHFENKPFIHSFMHSFIHVRFYFLVLYCVVLVQQDGWLNHLVSYIIKLYLIRMGAALNLGRCYQ